MTKPAFGLCGKVLVAGGDLCEKTAEAATMLDRAGGEGLFRFISVSHYPTHF